MHRALELVLKGADIDLAVSTARGLYLNEVRSGKDYESGFVDEQVHLLESLVRAWVRHRLPSILEEYEVVSAEAEQRWPLDSQIVDMIRCDAILRRKRDGLLFILEFKTAGLLGENWAQQWEYNSQVLANTMAIEELMGERVGGMLIEGLEKGKHRKEGRKSSAFLGQKIQQSPLCYAWYQPATEEFTAVWQRGARHVKVWEHMTAAEWVFQLSDEEVGALFQTAGPLSPNRQDLEDWKEQTILQETLIPSHVERINWLIAKGENPRMMLNFHFPKNHNHCLRYYGYPCPMLEACFNAQVAEDPIASGLYAYRTPHHDETHTEASHEDSKSGVV